MLEKLETKLIEILTNLNFNLVDLEYVNENNNNYLRVYIESKNGKTSLLDCENVSNNISDICDEYIKDKYFLEVSTPGLERNLKKPSDFKKFIGFKVLIKTKNNVYDRKSFTGILKGYENDNIFVDEFEIPFSKVKLAKTVYDFKDALEKEDKDNES